MPAKKVNLSDLTEDQLMKLFQDKPVPATCCDGKYHFNLITPNEENMKVIIEEILSGAESEDNVASSTIYMMQTRGQDFLQGHILTNARWRMLLRHSTNEERGVIFRHIAKCLEGWMGLDDPEQDMKNAVQKK